MALLETASGVISYSLEGPPGAPVIVLSSSLGTQMSLWDNQARGLKGRLRVLRYDHRGHGLSGAAPGPYTIADLGTDLLGLLDSLEIDSVAVCGISLGGMVAMWLASHAPERVGSLVLCCTAPALPPRDAWLARAAEVRERGLASVVEGLPPRWFTEAFRSARKDVVSSVVEMVAEADPEGYAGCCEAIAQVDLSPSLSRVRAPTLVVGGVDDPVVTPEMCLSLSRAIPGSSLLVLSGASHLACLEKPEELTTAILDHIQGTATQRGMRTRREVLGDAHVDAAAARISELSADFQSFITRYAWDEIWGRPGLERRARSVLTLGLLVALGRFEELSFHVPAALRNGLSKDEIKEVLLHCAVYAGVPAANSAFAVARAAFDRIEKEGP